MDSPASARALDAVQALIIEAACIRLLTAYCVSADRHDLPMFLDVFAQDAQWQRPGGMLTGHAEIGAYFKARSKEEITCHIASNALITIEGADRARGSSLVAVYRHRGDPAQVAELRPVSLVEYTDDFSRDGAGIWRIYKRASRAVLREAAQAPGAKP